MLRFLIIAALSLLLGASGHAADVGDECRLGTNVSSNYLCPIGKTCLTAISKKYCSHLGRVCGWPNTGGYSLGATKSTNGNTYKCNIGGFKKIGSTSSSSGSGSSSGSTASGTITVPGVTTLPTVPKVRGLFNAEVNLAKSVFGNTINYALVKVTNTVGFGSRPWTTNTPPIYTINVGVDAYKSMTNSSWRRLLIHELTHVWQGQHGVPFMSNSALHQTLSVINSGGNPGGAYQYAFGKQWNKYNVEQQASLVTDWYKTGRKTSSPLYPYIRDNIRKGKPNNRTLFRRKK